MKTILFASAAAMALAGAASAQQAYVNVGYTYLDTDGGIDFNAINLRGGYDFHPNFAVEAELLRGLGEEDVTVFGTPVDLELDYSVSIFGKAQFAVAEGFSLFARVGYNQTQIKIDSPALAVTAVGDDDDWAYGAGGEYRFGATGLNGIRFDYTRYEVGEADTFGISYVRRFGFAG